MRIDKITAAKAKCILYSAAPLVFGALVCAMLALVFSKSPSTDFAGFFTGVFSSRFYTGSFLNTAFLLSIAGLGAAAALLNGEYNLGGEGQIYAGGFVSAIVCAALKNVPPAAALGMAFTAACAVSAALALLSAVLRYYKGASVLLTSFLISSAAVPVINSLIAGPFRNAGNLLATQPIPENMRIPHILPPSLLSAAAFSAPVLCAAAWLIVYRTPAGRKLCINGVSKEFGRYCGYPQTKMLFSSLAVSGALHGAAGFFAVAGSYYTCHSGFHAGMGWNALTAALAASSNPAYLIPASLALSWIFTGADKTALLGNFSFNFTALVQGILLLCLSVKELNFNFSAALKALKIAYKKNARVRHGGAA
ncbi:MAG: ABC transporter permease subunit [Treponema sp.]